MAAAAKGPKRSVDKQLVNYSVTLSAGTTNKSALFPTSGGVTFPCTISGVRVVGTVYNASGNTPAVHFWAIQVIREGETNPNVSFTNLGSALTPEEDIIIWGKGITSFNSTTGWAFFRHYEVSGTTKRKLMIGDKLMMVANSSGANAIIDLAVMFFILI